MAMAALADAMVRVGLVDKEKVAAAQKEEQDAYQEYSKLSVSISKLIRDKRQIRDLQALAKRAGTAEDFFARIQAFVEITILNLENPTNQKMVQSILQEKLDTLETQIKPLMQKSHKLENKYGFVRPSQK